MADTKKPAAKKTAAKKTAEKPASQTKTIGGKEYEVTPEGGHRLVK